MDAIIQFYNRQGLDFSSQAILGIVLLLGLLIIFSIGRFIFGRHQNVSHAISSAIAILFSYLVIICIQHLAPQYRRYITSMPFVAFEDNQLSLLTLSGCHYTIVCAQLFTMIQLAFFTNLIDSWMPKKDHILAWAFFRILAVIFALALHLLICNILLHYLPQGITIYAPTFLVGILAALLLTGALKIPAGVFMLTVNPLIAGLYTFFFANFIGRLLGRSVLTAGLLLALSYTARYFGVDHVATTQVALISYIPFYALMVIFWYLVRSKKSFN